MNRLILLVTLSSFVLHSIAQTIDTTRYHLLQRREVKLVDSTLNFNAIPIIQFPLIGCLCDPIVRNNIGVSLISNIKKPLFGIGFDFDPIYYKRLNANLLFRYDFKKSFVFNSGLESNYLVQGIPLNFRFEFNNNNLIYTKVNNYHKYLGGLIYRKTWTKMSFLIGYDNYQDRGIGCEMGLNYIIHYVIRKCCEPYLILCNFSSNVGYWHGRYNYKLKLDYILNSRYRIGIGYEKLYYFNEFFVSVKFYNFGF